MDILYHQSLTQQAGEGDLEGATGCLDFPPVYTLQVHL